MNLRKLCWVAAAGVVLQSCIKEAPVNPEADIESFTIDKAQLTGDVFVDQTKSEIRLYLTEEAYEKGVVPKITVSEGAKISPASGDSIHFSSTGTIQYKVTSASGANSKTYTINVVNTGLWTFNFEKWDTISTEINDGHFLNPFSDDQRNIWSSGNLGIALTGVSNIEDFPMHATTDAYEGKYAAAVETKPGNDVSIFFSKIYLFPGNLFLGNFTTDNLFTNPLMCTQFGQPYKGMPTHFKGYYKYSRGTKFLGKDGKELPGTLDECSVYAVLYTGTTRLDGTNILTSDRIIATAILPDGTPKENWTAFDIPFTRLPGKNVMPGEKLMIAVVASSSKEGDQYRGAVGSRLLLDKLEIVHE